MKKRTPSWDLWQTAFLVPLAVVNLNQSKAIDAAHAHNAAIFRLCVSVICGIGLITVLILRSRAKKPVVEMTSPGAIMENAIGIYYHSTRKACWKCERYFLTHAPIIWFILAFVGFLLAFLAADWLYEVNHTLAYVSFPFLWTGGIALAFGFFSFVGKARLKQRFPTPDSFRICTTFLTPEGVEDQSPDKITKIEWKKLAWVRDYEGNLLFHSGVGAECYIPADAFITEERRSQFYKAAYSLWKSKGASWEKVEWDYYRWGTSSSWI